MTKDPLNGKELTLNRRSSDFRNGTIITTKILSYGVRILISSLIRLSRRSRWRAHDLCACDSTANREVGGREKREKTGPLPEEPPPLWRKPRRGSGPPAGGARTGRTRGRCRGTWPSR